MRKSRTLAKRMNALLSAFVFFIGVFFCSGERVKASDSLIDNNIFYKYGEFFTQGVGNYYSASGSSSSEIKIDIPFSSGSYNFHYIYYGGQQNGTLSSTEVPGYITFDFTLPVVFFLNGGLINNDAYSNGITYVDGRFQVSFYAALDGFYFTEPDLYLDSVELVDPFGGTYKGFIYDPRCSLANETTLSCNINKSKVNSSTANDCFYLYLHFKGSCYTYDYSSLNKFQLYVKNFAPVDFESLGSASQRYSPSLYVGDPSNDELYGYDSSAGNSASNALGDGIAEYDQAEGTLFDSSSDAIGNFSFISLDSVPAVATSISFVSSIMTMIFDQSGGITGAGIVMSISLCALIGSIVVGIYRYWHKDG